MTKMTQSEYARHRGISKQYVSKMVKLGGIKLDRNGKIDGQAADKSLDRKVRGETESFYDARARKETALASLRELELKVKRSEHLPAKDVEYLWGRHVMDCRARLLAIPSGLAPTLSPVKSIPEIQELIEARIYEALDELKNIDASEYGAAEEET